MSLALACCGAAAVEQPGTAATGTSGGTLPASLPLRRDLAAGSEPAAWGSPLLMLGLAGAAGAGVFWWRNARARTGAAAKSRSETAMVVRLSSQALTPHASVHAVQWNGEEYLVGCTAQQVTLLSRRPVDVVPEPPS
jgi:hypothetical protein